MSYPVQGKLRGLPDCPAVSAYRFIVGRLRDDPTLQGVGVEWFTWDGDPQASMPETVGDSPAIRITPGFGGTAFFATSNQAGPMTIKVEMLVPGLLPDNAMNLWAAMAAALFPADNTAYNSVINTLQPLGSQTGQVKFSQPAYDPAPDADGDGMWKATGLMQIDVRLRV